MLMWWRPAAGLSRSTLRWDLQFYLSILCARRYIEVQTILKYLAGLVFSQVSRGTAIKN